MNKSENLNELFAALSKAQAIIKGAPKDSKNPFFKSNYADLESVWEVIREPLAKNGLSIIQLPGSDGSSYTLTTMLCHSSGQFVSSVSSLPLAKVDSQTLGSAITYMRRYALAAIVGVYQTDDDGNHATHLNTSMQNSKKNNSQAPLPSDDLIPIFDDETVDLSTPFEIHSNPSKSYIIPIGKYKGQEFSTVPLRDLVSYADWIEKNSQGALVVGSPMFELITKIRLKVKGGN